MFRDSSPRSVNFTLSFSHFNTIDDQQPSAVVVTFPSLDDLKTIEFSICTEADRNPRQKKISFSLVSRIQLSACVSADEIIAEVKPKYVNYRKFSLAFALYFAGDVFAAKCSDWERFVVAQKGSEALRTCTFFSYWIWESFCEFLLVKRFLDVI